MNLLRNHLLAFGLFIGITMVFFFANAEIGGKDGGRGADDNSYMVDAEYRGSDSCQGCHSSKYDDWSMTLHTMKVRPITEDIVFADFTIQPNQAGYALEGYDIEIYHEDGTDEYYVNLAGENYTVDWVLGSGTWKQRFMVDIENGTFVLPIQWNTNPVEEDDF